MLQLKNNTPFSADIALFPDEQANDALYVMVKATFDITQNMEVSETQKPLIQADEYYGEPGLSSLKYPSDYHTGKPTSDILMLGSACAPDKHGVRQLNVSVQIDDLKKVLTVFGDRYWQDGQMSTPDIFETMRLRYENAFGGKHIVEGQLKGAELRNPVGKGFKGERNSLEMDGLALPNLEDPNDLIQNQSDAPQPHCFAAVAPNWLPRAEYAGTYDTEWEQERAPYLPLDYNPMFMNSASYGLRYPHKLEGGERVYISGMHPAGDLDFDLPKVNLKGTVIIAGSEKELSFTIETLTLEPNELSLCIHWRAKLNCGKHTSKIQEISVTAP